MRIASNKLIDIIHFFYSELIALYTKDEIEVFIKYCLEDFAGILPHHLNSQKTITVSESELLKLNTAVKDLKKQKPIQYILGNAHFYGLKFQVDERVLIPRPETEELVDLILKDHPLIDSKLNVIDIGTGSGCIPISIKKNKSDWTLSALDISSDALGVASKNAVINHVAINFVQADILNEKIIAHFNTKFDIIISNPPYIKISEKVDMFANVLEYEPHLALFVDNDDPLLFYKAILKFAKKMLHPTGKVYFEINEALGPETMELMLTYGFKNVELIKDINNKNRILRGVY